MKPALLYDKQHYVCSDKSIAVSSAVIAVTNFKKSHQLVFNIFTDESLAFKCVMCARMETLCTHLDG